MAKVIARSYFDERPRPLLVCPEASLAVQASKDETDLNKIITRYLKTGELPEMRQGIYADLSELGDLADAMATVDAAMDSFMSLPADVRRFFDNDPVKLVAFAEDPANLDKAVELGLAVKRPVDAGQGATPPSQPSPAAGQAASAPVDKTS